MVLLPILALLFPSGQVPQPFYDFLAKPDTSFAYTSKTSGAETTIDLTSQTWHGTVWKHQIILRQPSKLEYKGLAILYITGDGPKPADYSDLGLIVAGTGMPVASLFNIPNQPIEGLKEDDLIAHTFEKYLEDGDASWPLLFPMAKSAIRAMDAIVATTKDSANPITKFVVAGGSKRGWTTWFVGAAKDPRVIGIAPMVIDNLNVAKQMPHQLAEWGKYSEEIEEYTKRGLQAKLATPKGKVLGQLVDPYYYLPQITVPTLLVTGTNDPYWTADAMSLYWNDLKMPHWASIVPNAGHDLGNKIQAVAAAGALARSLAGEFKMPDVEMTITDKGITGGHRSLKVHATSKGLPFTGVRILTATADTPDFRLCKWTEAANSHGVVDGQIDHQMWTDMELAVPSDKDVAVLAEAHYEVGGRGFTLSAPVRVFKKNR